MEVRQEWTKRIAVDAYVVVRGAAVTVEVDGVEYPLEGSKLVEACREVMEARRQARQRAEHRAEWESVAKRCATLLNGKEAGRHNQWHDPYASNWKRKCDTLAKSLIHRDRTRKSQVRLGKRKVTYDARCTRKWNCRPEKINWKRAANYVAYGLNRRTARSRWREWCNNTASNIRKRELRLKEDNRKKHSEDAGSSELPLFVHRGGNDV